MKDNVNEMKQKLTELRNTIYLGCQKGLEMTNTQIKAKIIQNSQLPKTGEKYKIKLKSGNYKQGKHSNTSGETSGTITGHKNRMIRSSVKGLKSWIGADTSRDKYIEYLEKGSAGGKIKAREDTKKAGFEIVKKNLKNNIQNCISNYIKKYH